MTECSARRFRSSSRSPMGGRFSSVCPDSQPTDASLLPGVDILQPPSKVLWCRETGDGGRGLWTADSGAHLLSSLRNWTLRHGDTACQAKETLGSGSIWARCWVKLTHYPVFLSLDTPY